MSAPRTMYDERTMPRSPLERIPDLEPVDPEFMKRVIERHERLVLPEIVRREHERIEMANRIRSCPLS